MVSPSTSSPGAAQYHVLMVKDLVGQRAVILEAATYSLGRDPSNGIQLHSDSVSRQHALLLRVPNSRDGSGYHYRVMDGNSDGKRSANGVKVNGSRCESYDLGDGDVIDLSTTVSLTYRIVSNLAEVGITPQHLEAGGYRSIKSTAVERSSTLLMDDTGSGRFPPNARANAAPKPTVEERLPDSFFEDVAENSDSIPAATPSRNLLSPQIKLWIGVGAAVVGAVVILVVVLVL